MINGSKKTILKRHYKKHQNDNADANTFGYASFKKFKKEFGKHNWEYTVAGIPLGEDETLITNGDCGDDDCVIYPQRGYAIRFKKRRKMVMNTIEDYAKMIQYIKDYFTKKEKQKRIDW